MSEVKEVEDELGRHWRIYYDVTTSSTPYFSAAVGNWLPGDDAEVEITNCEMRSAGEWVSIPVPQAENILGDLENVVSE